MWWTGHMVSTPAWAKLVVALTTAGPLALVGLPGQLTGNSLATGLSPEQLAGQRVVYSYKGALPPASLLDKIRAGQAAGVIFFGENITAQLPTAVQQLKDANAQSPVKAPLLLMTDQEGGKVRRLPGAPELSEKQIGQSPDGVNLAAQAGTGAAQNLTAAGMNLNLSPVLDVYRKPGDFLDQAQRSYSTNPDTVSALGKQFVTAQQQAGVAATVKHFPGLGPAAAGENTDEAPVTINESLDELRSVDEKPYGEAIAAGAKLVMMSWATYPALDASLPAGLSPKVVGEELRGRLGYQGVTVTDALEAGGLRAFGGTEQRAVRAAKAGMDLILCSARDSGQGDAAGGALTAAFKSGQLDQAAFLGAAQRVLELRKTLH
ncbi:glycosyl hydrolase [Kutzneria albida DSM 43870]|uniref:Glycosyl hydrolase n=2 Tax=Kutzneria TaxID=43356 RepID=W5WCT3_9PSEU|nr:glycosyl hydrolase [Kutzneria albida DSM 43870]